MKFGWNNIAMFFGWPVGQGGTPPPALPWKWGDNGGTQKWGDNGAGKWGDNL